MNEVGVKCFWKDEDESFATGVSGRWKHDI